MSEYRITTNGAHFRIERWRRTWLFGAPAWRPLSYVSVYVETPAGLICTVSRSLHEIKAELAKLESLTAWAPVVEGPSANGPRKEGEMSNEKSILVNLDTDESMEIEPIPSLRPRDLDDALAEATIGTRFRVTHDTPDGERRLILTVTDIEP